MANAVTEYPPLPCGPMPATVQSPELPNRAPHLPPPRVTRRAPLSSSLSSSSASPSLSSLLLATECLEARVHQATGLLLSLAFSLLASRFDTWKNIE
uniref:Uncharacterized protein n=1 Tax=Oryza punctata TaxID=4537 RepID=A0A0E0JSU8_ORYPU